MLGNHLSWISCKFFYLSQPAGAMCHRNAVINSPQLWGSPLADGFPLVFPGCGVKSPREVKPERSRGQEAGAGEIPSSLLQSQLCTRVTNTLGSTFNAAYLCALPAGPSAASWERAESSQLK